MGRLRKYFTEEQKREADRKKCRRYYLRNRDVLKEKVLKMYYQKTGRTYPPEKNKELPKEPIKMFLEKQEVESNSPDLIDNGNGVENNNLSLPGNCSSNNCCSQQKMSGDERKYSVDDTQKCNKIQDDPGAKDDLKIINTKEDVKQSDQKVLDGFVKTFGLFSFSGSLDNG